MDPLRHESYMRRCFQLAELGRGSTKTNPLVGAVIVHKDCILGEGYHKAYGAPHAEVNAIHDVDLKDRSLLKASTLYVSLEPCNHMGKTPPCTRLIIKNEIGHVVISCQDPNELMRGKSVGVLREQGVKVLTGVLETEGLELIRPFTINQREKIPYIILKWAESADRFMGVQGRRVQISGNASRVMVHKWRSELDAIMVGTNTAITDDPLLNVRSYSGSNPQRVVIDRSGRIPATHQLLSDEQSTWIFTNTRDYPVLPPGKRVIFQENDLLENPRQTFEYLYMHGIGTILVEGGSELIASLLKAELWHEARIIRSCNVLGSGIPAPKIRGRLVRSTEISGDKVLIINKLKDIQS
jgi:diaminohydroxyphosphoribosylaminopyrimidine deaminase/5-amino-6-(5-phosphoribosylamino)uracil reductase